MVCYENQLIQKLRSLDTQNTLDFDLINKAIDWAKKYHDKQFRKSGEPFYTHPLQVAYMVSDYTLKTDVIVASILHDIIEDTEVTAGMLVDHFSWRIAQMVDRLTRDRPDGTKLSVEEILNNAYRPQDKEVLLIKTMDRLHNIENLQHMSSLKIEEIREETLVNFLLVSEYMSCHLVTHKIKNILSKFDPITEQQSILFNGFSFNDGYQPLALIYQSDALQPYSQ